MNVFMLCLMTGCVLSALGALGLLLWLWYTPKSERDPHESGFIG
jgi:hypothetical protein